MRRSNGPTWARCALRQYYLTQLSSWNKLARLQAASCTASQSGRGSEYKSRGPLRAGAPFAPHVAAVAANRQEGVYICRAALRSVDVIGSLRYCMGVCLMPWMYTSAGMPACIFRSATPSIDAASAAMVTL